MRLVTMAALVLGLHTGAALAQTDNKPSGPDNAVPKVPAPTTAEPDLRQSLETLGAAPCDAGALTCVTLQLPYDPFQNSVDANLPMTFAISLATEPSRGILFYAVGGPGASGLSVADDYLTAFDPALVAAMDIVFFDQRGVGPAHGLSCPGPQAVFDTADMSLDLPEQALATAQTYVADCIAALEDPDLLGFVSTDHAILDLERFRKAIGSPQIWIYGESYGTQLAQQYATRFPAAVRGVLLDGVVDLNLGFRGYYQSYALASENILARTLADCAALPDCATDMGGPAEEVYDALADELADAPLEVVFPLADGTTTQRFLTDEMLETNAFYALYAPESRAGFLRALAASGRGDHLPMLRLGYSNLYVDPETERGQSDESWFGAAYFAITCADYAEGETPDAEAILEDARAYASDDPRLIRAYFAERLVCAFWPNRGDATRPEPFEGGDYPTLILNSDMDPITPVSMSYSVMDNVRNGYLTVMQGGPHVIWGRGLGCPDQTVSRLLLEGVLPAKTQLCEQPFLEGYVGLTLTNPDDAANPLVLGKAVEVELAQSPELSGWDYGDPLTVGCNHGGTVTASLGEDGVTYAFAGCSMWPGIVVDGSGLQVDLGAPGDGLTLDLSMSGTHEGQIGYRHDTFEETWEISGLYDGAEVTLPRPLP